MPKLGLNLTASEVEGIVEEEKKQVPVGTYRAEVFNAVLGETSQNSKTPGRPMLILHNRIIEHAEFNGKEFLYWCVLPHGDNTKGLSSILNACTALGVDFSADTDTEDFMGKEAYINIVHKDNSDKSGKFAQMKSYKE